MPAPPAPWSIPTTAGCASASSPAHRRTATRPSTRRPACSASCSSTLPRPRKLRPEDPARDPAPPGVVATKNGVRNMRRWYTDIPTLRRSSRTCRSPPATTSGCCRRCSTSTACWWAMAAWRRNRSSSTAGRQGARLPGRAEDPRPAMAGDPGGLSPRLAHGGTVALKWASWPAASSRTRPCARRSSRWQPVRRRRSGRPSSPPGSSDPTAGACCDPKA